jgi:hypothetical protein
MEDFMKSIIIGGAICVALPVFGCASYPAPTDHLANSYATIRAAQEVGAPTIPQAALHLRLAQEEQAKAKDMVANDRNQEADYMTMRANADAELAMAMAREATAHTKSSAASVSVTEAAKDNHAMAPNAAAFSATTTTTSTTVPAPSPSK